MKPEFITFTGVDDNTNIYDLIDLANQYPIEFGILFSPDRQGVDPRYPSIETVSRLCRKNLVLSAHLCGDYTKRIMNGEEIELPFDSSAFNRAQINHSNPDMDKIISFALDNAIACIMQVRDTFPTFDGIEYLFDKSGGRGIEIDSFPEYPGNWCGYAGGFGPDNVAEMISKINASGIYWIDMETKIRTDNKFDISKCRKVCEIVFG